MRIKVQEFRQLVSPKTRVLVVDDDTDLRLTVCEYLESLNLTVNSVRDGREAIGVLRDSRFQFDIIFTDLMMPPGPDGLEVMKTAKQLHPLCYVVIMTGYSCLDTALESTRRGAFDYVAKPFQLFELEILVDRIKEHLSLLDDNKRLSQRLANLTDHLQTMNSRLGRIEGTLSMIVANLMTQP
jgi:DNA-binding NtrC family response regulator